jgi:tRNA(Arg) A34 adenosine deaminase TadA
MDSYNEQFMAEAIRLATENVKSGKGGPFGAVIVKDGKIIGMGVNLVTSNNDPTAHAEVVAIRKACKDLSSFQLDGCEIYASCEPCPMCLGAIYWARPDKLYFAGTKKNAADIGFDDSFIYDEINLPYDKRNITTLHIKHSDALMPFNEWKNKEDKIEY